MSNDLNEAFRTSETTKLELLSHFREMGDLLIRHHREIEDMLDKYAEDWWIVKKSGKGYTNNWRGKLSLEE